jgi:FkbM family methyltransferase
MRIKLDIPFLIKDMIACKFDLQEWINRRSNKQPEKIVGEIINPDFIDYVVSKDGLKFYPKYLKSVGDVLLEYHFDDLTKDDVVLDLGANIGAFALHAARTCKRVYAIEPLFYKELYDNIVLNDLCGKILVIPAAIGNGTPTKISFDGKENIVKTMSLGEFRRFAISDITFIKIDIEGAEWLIKPEELDGIRRIEFEVHTDNGIMDNPNLIEYIKKNWKTTITNEPKFHEGYYIHAGE